jgi:hypothetical protein
LRVRTGKILTLKFQGLVIRGHPITKKLNQQTRQSKSSCAPKDWIPSEQTQLIRSRSKQESQVCLRVRKSQPRNS